MKNRIPNSVLRERSDKLKSKETDAEKIFKFKLIKAGFLWGKKRRTETKENQRVFLIQKVISNKYCSFIADFYIKKPYNVYIEIDGEYHNSPFQKGYDFWKDSRIQRKNCSVWRLTNDEAIKISIFEMQKKLELFKQNYQDQKSKIIAFHHTDFDNVRDKLKKVFQNNERES